MHLLASGQAVCREAATPTLCLPHEGGSWWGGMTRAPISLRQTGPASFLSAHLEVKDQAQTAAETVVQPAKCCQ